MNFNNTAQNYILAFNKTIINEKAFNNSNSDHSDGRIPSNISQGRYSISIG